MNLSPVWILVNPNNGSSAFRLRGSMPGALTVGPFAFSNPNIARQVAKSPNKAFPLLALAPAATLLVKKMPGAVLIKWIATDVNKTEGVVLDGNLMPLTRNGARWMDRLSGDSTWIGHYSADTGRWRDKVAALVVDMLKQFGEADIKEMAQLVKLHIVPEPRTGHFWLYTRGMDHYDLPDFEMRDVHALYAPYVAGLLQNWAIASRKEPLKAGDILSSEFPVSASLRLGISSDPYWIGKNQCLTVSVASINTNVVAPSETYH